MENRIEVNYMTGLLLLIFEGIVHEFDLKKGDAGEFWHGFLHNGKHMDLNFHVNDDLIASASVYGTITNDDDTISTDTSNETYIENKNVKEVGELKYYLTWLNDDESKDELTHQQRLEYAKHNLEGKDITSKIENNTLYVSIGDSYYELADAEINFQAKEYVDYVL